jgi:hypothetical protein
MSKASEFNPENLTYGSDNKESRERLRELMLHIAELSHGDPRFGLTKLNKILFYCDFMAFGKFGKSITGTSYEKLQFGPVPSNVESVRRQMRQDDDIYLDSVGYGTFATTRIVARRSADLNLFSGPEVALVDRIVDEFSDLTGSQLRDLSHGRAWQAVEMFEAIPYETVFVSDEPYTEEDIARAHELIALGELED